MNKSELGANHILHEAAIRLISKLSQAFNSIPTDTQCLSAAIRFPLAALHLPPDKFFSLYLDEAVESLYRNISTNILGFIEQPLPRGDASGLYGRLSDRRSGLCLRLIADYDRHCREYHGRIEVMVRLKAPS